MTAGDTTAQLRKKVCETSNKSPRLVVSPPASDRRNSEHVAEMDQTELVRSQWPTHAVMSVYKVGGIFRTPFHKICIPKSVSQVFFRRFCDERPCEEEMFTDVFIHSRDPLRFELTPTQYLRKNDAQNSLTSNRPIQWCRSSSETREPGEVQNSIFKHE